MTNYTELTTHVLKVPTVPKIGQKVSFNIARLSQDDDGEGNRRTPMTKLRYNAAKKQWQQVGKHEAGMMVFFKNEPEAFHTAFVIDSIIPSKTACYATLV